MELDRLFAEHLAALLSELEQALPGTGFETLVISSGAPMAYFSDDDDAPFRPTPHFAYFCPAAGPHHLLRLAPGRKPLLIRYAPEDFWYEPSPLGEPYWLPGFELREVGSVDGAWRELGVVEAGAYVGNETGRAEAAGLAANPPLLTARLDWARSYKTPYEVRCLEEATESAARGHLAAREAFLAGASEIEIHHAFVRAVGVTDSMLAYPTIVALDEKGATLHYQGKRSVKPGKVLLIDAGARSRGYGSDITRTHTAPGCDPRFAALRDGMEHLQAGLCAAVQPGLSYVDLHLQAHVSLAGLLKEHGLIHAGPEEAVEKGLTRAFFPHGLGHHLGLQIHDVAGRQCNPDGRGAPPPADHPFLRNTRTIEPRHAFTVEPGLYFIPMLLRPLRTGEHAALLDWGRIDALAPNGGIRIEDNVLVTETGHRNLTRAHLP